MKKNGCIISGGGRNGAWGVGVLSSNYNLTGVEYDFVAGTSTGALMAPFVALSDYDSLREAYTSISNKDIYSVSPVNSKGNIRVLNAIWRVARNLFKPTQTFGESEGLRDLIDTFFTKDMYDDISASGKEVSLGVSEIRHSDGDIYYPSIKDSTYDSFKDFMWASANAPFLFSILEKRSHLIGHEDGQFIDGGLSEVLPYKPVLDKLSSGDHVDIIAHRKPDIFGRLYDRGPVKDQVHLLQRCFSIMRDRIEGDNIIKALEMAKSKGISVDIYYIHPYLVTGNALNFNKDDMNRLYEAGLNNRSYKDSHPA